MTGRVLLLGMLLLGAAFSSTAQVRVSKLIIPANSSWVLENSDILVADTLIMEDSSRLVLNKFKPENYIRARVVIFGRNCSIDGKGLNGQSGKSGLNGTTPVGPCSNGTAGRNGGRGLDGTPGINLFMYIEDVKFNGQVFIDLSGGNGGKGGDGGSGGSGSPGTVHCHGGNGGNGGNAGQGGNGADGGTLTLSSSKNPFIKNLIGSLIHVYTYGGLPGPQGLVGSSGQAGLGPSRRHGKNGSQGLDAPTSIAGLSGKVNFEKN